MVKFLWPLAMATLVAPMHAAAQIPGPAPALTLRAALALAAQAHPALVAAQYEVQAQDGLLLQASARLNPTLSFEQTGRGGAGAETIFLISQPLELGAKRQARMRVAERGRDSAGATLEAQRAELHSAVLAAFFDVLVAQERLRLAQDGNELAQSATLAASRRVASGKVSPVDETKARLAEANVRLESASASAALASARRRLSAYWADPTPRFEKAEGDIGTLPEPPDSALLARWREQSPALLPARLEVERRKAVAQLEQANRTPDLTVNVGSKRSGDPARNQAVLGLSIPLPLFERNQGGTLAAQRQADKSGAELAATASRLENELAQSVQELDAARSALALLRREILPAAQQASDAARKGFEFGKHSFLDVLDAQRTLLQARAQYLSALSDGHRAAAAIERILGHTANEH